ncbi:DUF3616 domain-containing protein [Desulforhopalus vacuolatus]|uniref:DUF3616 domain-containing protein n=1 Tax=Desulforhopalus vacuolatus TaxID=40414 RepID=UPI001962B21D|nr:DUF3616 domain-containing protein [Desulforhopalus vacuolatus]MBM9520330.1 DUF3616 domain-containing protein [Desulforhopalus vacuolatus]
MFVCVGLLAGLLGAATVAVADSEWKPLISEADSSVVYEPSAVRQLPDGGLLLVQDESDDPFVIVQLAPDDRGITFQRPLLAEQDQPSGISGRAESRGLEDLEDLEGLAAGIDGYLYAITSHSHTESGERRKSRERFVRLRIESGQIRDYAVFGKLRKAIITAYPELKAAARSGHDKGQKGFNIEGLCSQRDKSQLLIGLRSPILDGDSLILVMRNPAAVFDHGEEPMFESEPLRLNLDKGGIRAITYVPRLDIYLLVTQKARKKGTSDRPFQLWLWDGRDGAAVRPLQIPDISLRNTEGITPVRLGGRDYLLLVSDDGNRSRNIPGHYMLLPLSALGLPLQPE